MRTGPRLDEAAEEAIEHLRDAIRAAAVALVGERSVGHKDLCLSDDCPCFRAGEKAAAEVLAERSAEVLRGIRDLADLLEAGPPEPPGDPGV